VILVAAGIIGGTISALVGGAAIVTFPAVIAAGLSPVVATRLQPGDADSRQLPRVAL